MIELKGGSEKANRFTTEIKEQATAIRNQLYRACLTKFPEVVKAKNNLPQIGLAGRFTEIWQGILSIAWLIGDDTWHNVSWLAIESTKAMKQELITSNPTWDLLEILLDFVSSGKPKFYTNEAIFDYLTRLKGETFGGKKGITQILKQQGFRPIARRVNHRVCRGIMLERDVILERLNFLTGVQFEK